LLRILLKDSWKIAMIEKQELGYKKSDIAKVLELAIPFEEDVSGISSFELPDISVSTIPAGHVPGSRSIYLDIAGMKLLYTGDISITDNVLIRGLNINTYPKNIDVLIIESTYGGTDHPSRESVAEEFLEHVKTTIEQGGHVVIPTFSIGRAQELIMLLHEAKISVPIYFDGMAKSITEIFLSYPEYLRNSDRLTEAFHSVRLVTNEKDREAALSEQSIIVTTAGMLDGGPICYYLPRIAKSQKTALLLTGYQADNSNGRKLLDEGYVEVDNKKYSIMCDVKKYDFSGHAGMSELQEIITYVNPKHVIIQHGEGAQIRALKAFIEQNTSAQCHMPKTGERINITKAL
jgi:putative mRNA 3-end processing factor